MNYLKIIFRFFVRMKFCAIISLAIRWHVYFAIADKSEYFDILKK